MGSIRPGADDSSRGTGCIYALEARRTMDRSRKQIRDVFFLSPVRPPLFLDLMCVFSESQAKSTHRPEREREREREAGLGSSRHAGGRRAAPPVCSR